MERPTPFFYGINEQYIFVFFNLMEWAISFYILMKMGFFYWNEPLFRSAIGCEIIYLIFFICAYFK